MQDPTSRAQSQAVWRGLTDRGVRTHILTKKIASKKQLVRGHRLQCPRLLGQNNYYLPRKVITETTISVSVSATCRPGT